MGFVKNQMFFLKNKMVFINFMMSLIKNNHTFYKNEMDFIKILQVIPISRTKVTIEKNREDIIVETRHCLVFTKKK